MAFGELTIEVDPLIESLLRRAVVTLDRAGLDASLTRLGGVLGRREMIELATSTCQPLRVQLKPFVELALREAIDVGADRRLDGATKTRRIAETFAIAGL